VLTHIGKSAAGISLISCISREGILHQRNQKGRRALMASVAPGHCMPLLVSALLRLFQKLVEPSCHLICLIARACADLDKAMRVGACDMLALRAGDAMHPEAPLVQPHDGEMDHQACTTSDGGVP